MRIRDSILNGFGVIAMTLSFAFLLPYSDAGATASKSGASQEFKPYFVSTKAGKINVRTGPAKTYPIEWIYNKSGLPLEVVSEEGIWRKVKDWDGTMGWVTKSAVYTKRRAFRTLALVELRRLPEPDSIVFANIEAGATGRILSCPMDYPDACEVEIQGATGWINKSDFWGAYAQETIE